MEDLDSDKQSGSEKQSPIKVADSWDSSNNSVNQISSMPQLDIDDFSQPGTSATDKNQTGLQEIFSQPGTSGTGQSELMDLLENTTHNSGLEGILSQPGASVTDQSNPTDLLGYAVATNYNLFGFEYQYPVTSSGSSEQLVDVLPPAVPSLGNEFEEKKLTTKMKRKRFGNKGNKDDKKSGGSDCKGKKKGKTAKEKKSGTKGKKLKKVEESEEETEEPQPEEPEENKENETEETEDEEKPRGPRKGTGGRPTIEMQLKNLQLEVNDIVKSNTVQKDFSMQLDIVDVPMQLDIVDVSMQHYVAVQKIDAPIDINMEQKVPAERDELLMQQDGVFKHRDNIAIHHDDPLHDNASIQKNNDEDLDNNEVIDPGCLFPDNDPSLTQILILCNQFTKENEDAMIEFFSMRHPIDQIGRSARRKLFIVKSVVKEYSKTAMKELNETEFKEHDIKARKWMNRGEFMLPKICLFTDKRTSKK